VGVLVMLSLILVVTTLFPELDRTLVAEMLGDRSAGLAPPQLRHRLRSLLGAA